LTLSNRLWNFAYTDSSLDGPVNEFGRSMRASIQATNGMSTQGIYVNYAHGEEAPETLYGARKLPKLRALKKQWDPDNLFRFYNSLQ
jgi:hypothetical protein